MGVKTWVDGTGKLCFTSDVDETPVQVNSSSIPGASALPAGLIVMWYGLIAQIPAGWVLCNGLNGTPDMRGLFPKGAAAGVEAGSTGGSATHTHTAHASHTHDYSQVVNHTHTVTVTDPGHSHVITSQTATTGSATSYEHGVLDTSSAEAEATETTNSATTGISATTANPAGGVAAGTTTGPSASLTHDSPNSEPPYRTVLFIMKT